LPHDPGMTVRSLIGLAALVAAASSDPGNAELPKGAVAPQFVTQGALAGKVFPFNLRAALRKGPVVLYFYPKSFTQGCTLEAHAFAEAMPQFKAAGATVIGLSADDIATQQKFSTEACRDAFPVGIASPAVVSAYDVALKRDGVSSGLASRTSYVIDRQGRVAMSYTNMDYRDHVRLTLEAVKALNGAKPR